MLEVVVKVKEEGSRPMERRRERLNLNPQEALRMEFDSQLAALIPIGRMGSE